MNEKIAKTPSTRWDRLVVAFEEVEPERVLEVQHILERCKKQNISDLMLFCVLSERYQQQTCEVSFEILSLLVLMDSFLTWFKCLTDGLFTENKESVISNTSESKRLRGNSKKSSGSPVSPNTKETSVLFQELGVCDIDFLRDFKLLCVVIEKSVELAKRRYNQNQEAPAPKCEETYDEKFPPLPTIVEQSESNHSPRHVFFDHRNKKKFAKKTSLSFNRRSSTVEETAARLKYFNSLCREYFNWKKKDKGDRYAIVFSSDKSLTDPTNGDDLYTLQRLHLFAVSLFIKIGDPTIVPIPPRVSFILSGTNPSQAGVDSTDEDSEFAFIVATCCSRLPPNNLLNVRVTRFNVVEISHKTAHLAALEFLGTVLENEAFIFLPEDSMFVPFWRLVQTYLKKWDNVDWFFEQSPEKASLEEKLFGCRPPSSASFRFSSRTLSYTKNSGIQESGAFDLQIKTVVDSVNEDGIKHSNCAVIKPSGELEKDSEKEERGVDKDMRPREKLSFRDPNNIHYDDSVWDEETCSSTAIPASTVGNRRQKAAAVKPLKVITPEKNGESSHVGKNPIERENLKESTPEVHNANVVGSHIQASRGHSVAILRDRISQSFSEEPLTPLIDEEFTTTNESYFHSGLVRPGSFVADIISDVNSHLAVKQHNFRVSGRPIGKGAFGAVYKALDLETGKIMAVKQSRYTYERDELNQNRREFEMWSILPPHPNVITFYGASEEVETNQLLLVLEYASGGSIISLYNSFHPMPENLFLKHAKDIAMGLNHLHNHNVIHGDVKPENVLTRTDGSVAISDFGCSHLQHTGSVIATDARHKMITGTVPYMSPEVIMCEPHTPKSDVLAYTCMLVYLWTGELPWSGVLPNFSELESIPLIYHICNSDGIPFSEEKLRSTPRWLQKIASISFVRDDSARCTMKDILALLTEYDR